MKKLITFFAVMALFAGALSAQDCQFFKVAFNVIPATCFNNGKVAYTLLDQYDNPITMLANLGLDSVRIYSKANEGDSAHYSHLYTGGWDTLVIKPGEYIIGVEGICECGTGCYVKVDTHQVMEITTTYVYPVVESFSNVATTESGITSLGMQPTIHCMNTGRVQLKIQEGKFPFTVNIINQADPEDTLRTETRMAKQYSGTDPNRYDYRDYYSFDSLPAGNWEFHIEDGCGVKMPIHTQEVTVVEFPKAIVFEGTTLSYESNNTYYADSIGNKVISVSVRFDNSANDMFSNRYRYIGKYFPELVEYRFIYEGGACSDWKPVPPQYGYYLARRDTSQEGTRGEWVGDAVTVEYRDNCWDTIHTRTFKLWYPYIKKGSESWHTKRTLTGCSERESQYNCQQIYLTDPPSNNNGYSNIVNSSVKKPLVWIYIDLNSGDTIKRDTAGFGIPYADRCYGKGYPGP